MSRGNDCGCQQQATQLRLRRLISQPRPYSIETMHDERQKQRETNNANDCVSNPSMMMKVRPTIAKEENGDIDVRSICGKNAYCRCAGGQSFQTRLGRSQSDESMR